MSPDTVEPKQNATEVDKVDKVNTDALQDKNIHQSDVLVNADLMKDAFDAENKEHDMGVWEAVKTHPMACFWAFIFCFTIVSLTAIRISSSPGTSSILYIV